MKPFEMMTRKEFDAAYSEWAEARWSASRYAGQGINLSANLGQFVPRKVKSYSVDDVQRNAIKAAIELKKPLLARTVNALKIKLPNGYMREGDCYVFGKT